MFDDYDRDEFWMYESFSSNFTVVRGVGNSPSIFPENIPLELRELPHWVVWKYGGRRLSGKREKPPYSAKTGKKTSIHWRDNFASFDVALSRFMRGGFDGLGLGLFEPDLVAIDLDNCIMEGELSRGALEIVEAFSPSYCEVSPSGKGLRIFCRGVPKRCGKGGQLENRWVEIYNISSPRYMTITGNILSGDVSSVLCEKQEALDWFHREYVGEKAFRIVKGKQTKAPFQQQPVYIPMREKQLIDKAKKASNGHRFSRLYEGDWDDRYPSQSEADLAFCGMLAFWTKKNEGMMDSIFRSSGLIREKWDVGNPSYGDATISLAVSRCSGVYKGS